MYLGLHLGMRLGRTLLRCRCGAHPAVVWRWPCSNANKKGTEVDEKPQHKAACQPKPSQKRSTAPTRDKITDKFLCWLGVESSSWLHIGSRIDATDRMDQLVMLAFNQCRLIGLSHGPFFLCGHVPCLLMSSLLSLELSRSMKCNTYSRRNK